MEAAPGTTEKKKRGLEPETGLKQKNLGGKVLGNCQEEGLK